MERHSHIVLSKQLDLDAGSIMQVVWGWKASRHKHKKIIRDKMSKQENSPTPQNNKHPPPPPHTHTQKQQPNNNKMKPNTKTTTSSNTITTATTTNQQQQQTNQRNTTTMLLVPREQTNETPHVWWSYMKTSWPGGGFLSCPRMAWRKVCRCSFQLYCWLWIWNTSSPEMFHHQRPKTHTTHHHQRSKIHNNPLSSEM